MKWLTWFIAGEPFDSDSCRKAAVIEEENESAALEKFSSMSYSRCEKNSLLLDVWGRKNHFAIIQKHFYSNQQFCTAPYCTIAITNTTDESIENYLRKEWDGTGVDDLSHLSAWDYHPPHLAHMRDTGLVYARIFKAESVGMAEYVKTIQLLRR